MTSFPQPTFRMLVGVCFTFLTEGCGQTLQWVADPLPGPSCLPDRLLQWNDFIPRQGKEGRAAETAVRFTTDHKNGTLRVEFDPEHSWVKPELADPQNLSHRHMSEQLLAHEQIHYLISCLVVRQANLSRTPKDNLPKKLELARSVAQRLNLQYDTDTHHGINLAQQDAWQDEVMRQFVELGSFTKNTSWD